MQIRCRKERFDFFYFLKKFRSNHISKHDVFVNRFANVAQSKSKICTESFWWLKSWKMIRKLCSDENEYLGECKIQRLEHYGGLIKRLFN